jgi:hypothetical protein
MKNIAESDLGAGDYQDDEPQRIYPVPDPYRQRMKIYLVHYFLPPFPILLSDLIGEVMILRLMCPIGTAIPPISATMNRISKSLIFVLPRA